MNWSAMMFGHYSADSCCGCYLDNLWLCWVRVRAVPWCNECQMLPLQASKQVLSWCEPTSIHVHTVTYNYIPVHTGTYYHVIVCTSMYWYLLIFTFLFRCWGAGVCAGHHCSGPILSLQNCWWYGQCSICRLLVCMPPAIPSLSSATWVQLADCLSPKNHSYAWVVWQSYCGRDCNEEEIVKTDQAKCSVETRMLRREDGVWSNEVCCFVDVCTCMYEYIPVCTSMYLE